MPTRLNARPEPFVSTYAVPTHNATHIGRRNRRYHHASKFI